MRTTAKHQIDILLKQFKEHVALHNITLPSSVKVVEVGPRDGL